MAATPPATLHARGTYAPSTHTPYTHAHALCGRRVAPATLARGEAKAWNTNACLHTRMQCAACRHTCTRTHTHTQPALPVLAPAHHGANPESTLALTHTQTHTQCPHCPTRNVFLVLFNNTMPPQASSMRKSNAGANQSAAAGSGEAAAAAAAGANGSEAGDAGGAGTTSGGGGRPAAAAAAAAAADTSDGPQQDAAEREAMNAAKERGNKLFSSQLVGVCGRGGGGLTLNQCRKGARGGACVGV